MDNKESIEQMVNYEYLVGKFGREKILSRYEWLYNLMEIFLSNKNLEKDVIVSSDILNHVVIDYFVDIDRLKDFQNIKLVNESKIYAYLAFWLLRHKPLQINRTEQAEELVFVNEEFVSYFIRGYLFAQAEVCPVVNNQREKVENFVETLLYYFKYRDYSARSIELIILAFQAGMGYQYSIDRQ